MNIRQILALAFVFLLSPLVSIRAQHAPTYGTVIPNKAIYSYVDAAGFAQNGESNIVEANVGELVLFTLEPNNFIKQKDNRRVQFTHTLNNSGNSKRAVFVQVNNIFGSNFDFVDIGISVVDPNASEEKTRSPFLTIESNTIVSKVEINSNDTREITVDAYIPNELRVGDVGKINVSVFTESGFLLVQNRDSVEILAGTQIQLNKVIQENEIKQGGDITFKITGTNTGDVRALAIPIKVDNLEEKKVLVRDYIPANTQFKAFGTVEKGLKLYHNINSSLNEFTSVSPSDLSEVDMIAVGYDAIDVLETIEFDFIATINANASGEIQNVAEVVYDDGLGEQISESASNQVVAPLPTLNATIYYYTNALFDTVTNVTDIGQDLFVQADASGCNLSPLKIDSTFITIISQKTGDEETYLAVETKRNSGMFRIGEPVSTRNGLVFLAEKQNKFLETINNDVLIATLDGCGIGSGVEVTATVFVTPKGYVFDSETNQPISGASVKILDVTNSVEGVPATVFDSKGVELMPSEIRTDGIGEFSFPRLNTGKYKIIVTPETEQYIFPSSLTPDQLPTDRNVDIVASYGNEFTISEPYGPARYDIPIDVNGALAIDLLKEADRETVDIGGFVNYSITITNKLQKAITDIKVTDELPFGFLYVKGSARVDSQKIEDPIGGKGPMLEFTVGNIDVAEKKVLKYRLEATIAAVGSEGKNTAIAIADEPILKASNESQVTVKAIKGLFSDEAFIVGKVYYDKNKNKMQDKGEPGIPGIRIYMENGNYIETDALGKYSFYGIKPIRHVLKLDVTTIPTGGGLIVLDNRNAFDASSRFVDLQNGELQKADFAVCDETGTILDEVLNRFNKLTDLPAELAQGLQARMEAKQIRFQRDLKALPSSGLVGGMLQNTTDKNKNVFKPVLGVDADESFWITESFTPTDVQLETFLEVSDAKLAFLNLQDGDTLRYAKTSVMFKGPINAKYKFTLNQDTVASNRIGKKAKTNLIEGFDYIGLDLVEGKNTLSISMMDPFGNERGKETITIYAPGQVEKLRVTVLDELIPADGKSYAKMRIEVLDKNDFPVKSRTPITIDYSIGQLLTKDLNPKEPGTQQFIEGGDGIAFLEAPTEAGTSKIKVTTGIISAHEKIEFIPDLRPLIAAGIIEGSIRLKNGFRVEQVNGSDAFEEELRSLNLGNDNLSASARTSFFIKGKILGSYLLTASFDSEKDQNRTMFRDIQPDEYYPVYGDASIKGFDAQSSGRLYVRIDHYKNYALFGDFSTMEQNPQRNLGQYTRNVTGAKVHYETDILTANAAAVISDSRQIIEEIPALGVSGPYPLKTDKIKENSERVEIITRDRNQPDVIIETLPMSRFLDYTIEPFTGHLFFKRPVSSMDENLNNRYIRISYEADEVVDQFLVASTDAQVKLTEKIEVGATAYYDGNPDASYQLYSVNSAFKIAEQNTIIAEVAGSNHETQGTGIGGRVELKHQGKVFNGRVFAGKTGEDFVNPFSNLGSARTEAGLRGTFKLADKTMLQSEALFSKNDTTGALRQGAMVNIQRGFGKGFQAELGVRYSKDVQQVSSDSISSIGQGSVRGKLTSDIPFVKSGQVYGEYEQSIAAMERKIAALGGEYQLGSRGRAYARHEFISSLQGRYALNDQQQQNNTIFGIDAGYMKNGRVFSEYRSKDAFDGRTTQAAIGVRNQFVIREGFGVTAGVERIFSIAGAPANEGTAITLGIDYTAQPNWKASARLETRFSKLEDMYLSTLGYAHRISNQWSFLGKNTFALNVGETQDRILQRFRAGFAYRESAQSRWNYINRYEFIYEDNNSFKEGVRRYAHVISNHVNWNPGDDFYLSARYAGKYAFENSLDFTSSGFMQLLGLRAIYDLTKRFDIGASTGLLSNASFSSKQFGAGAEVGFIVAKNLRLAVGYNFLGYRDKDLNSAEFTGHGVYLTLHYKFDEQEIYKVTGGKPADYPDIEDCGCNEQKVEFVIPETKIPDLVAAPVKMLEIPQRLILPRDIHFALNKSYISLHSAQMLDQLAAFMRDNGDLNFELIGHTDSRNTAAYNLALSKRRGEAVKSYLIAAGVDSTLLQIVAKGKTDRRVKNETNAVHQSENRIVEISVDSLPRDVELVSQFVDLQVERNDLRASVKNLDFLMNSEGNVVADRLYFSSNRTNLTDFSRLSLDLIATVLENNADVTVELYGFDYTSRKMAQTRAKNMIDYFVSKGLDANRFSFDFKIGTSEDEVRYGNYDVKNAIFFTYIPPDNLKIVSKTEDYRHLLNTGEIPSELKRMAEIQKNRTDQVVLNKKIVENKNIAKAVHFDGNSADLDHKTEAVLARLIAYLVSHPDALVQVNAISGNEVTNSSSVINKRLESISAYLEKHKISKSRITTQVEVRTMNPIAGEFERAMNRRVEFEITNKADVNYIEQFMDVKSKAKPDRNFLNKIISQLMPDLESEDGE